jgi:flavin-dependent dehydrogenase
MERYDAAVLGGGPAGCACAIQLARRGCGVLLVDRRATRRQPGEALPPSVNRFLRDLGLGERFRADGHLPSFANLSAWGSDALWSTDFIRDPDGHGWHTDRPKFDGMLRRAAAEAGARVCAEASTGQWWRRADNGWRLRIQDHEASIECEAAWLVDSTGRSAAVARSQGVTRCVLDSLIAFVGVFDVIGSHTDTESVTLIEATESGWWYTARVPGGCRLAVYFTDARGRTSGIARTSAGYESLLAATKHIGPRLTCYRVSAPPFAIAANTSTLEQPWGCGWVAAGDAAAAHDPLSSMGIGAALAGGMRAADAVCEALAGDAQALSRYATAAAASFEKYRKACASHYAEERRWPGDPFWRSRASGFAGS